jgi:hypothetical protein
LALQTLDETAGLVNSITKIHQTPPASVDIFGNRKAIAYNGNIEIYDDDHLTPPTSLTVSTLTGVVDFIKTELASRDTDSQIVVQVVSPNEVRVVAPIVGDFRQQFTYLISKAVLPTITTRQYMDVEEFIIQTQSMFAKTDDQEGLLMFLGSVKVEKSVNMADDGIGQTVSTKAGVVRVDVNVPVKNPWSLAPFRTFPEVAQPVSPFIIRMDKDANVALFDADGGAWRIAAIKSIGDWLRAALADQETAEGSTSQPLAVKVIS